MITCALWDIESLELHRRFGPSGLLSNSRDSISHSAHVIIVYPIHKPRYIKENRLDHVIMSVLTLVLCLFLEIQAFQGR